MRWLLRGLSWLLRNPLGGGVYLAVVALVGGIRQPDAWDNCRQTAVAHGRSSSATAR